MNRHRILLLATLINRDRSFPNIINIWKTWKMYESNSFRYRRLGNLGLWSKGTGNKVSSSTRRESLCNLWCRGRHQHDLTELSKQRLGKAELPGIQNVQGTLLMRRKVGEGGAPGICTGVSLRMLLGTKLYMRGKSQRAGNFKRKDSQSPGRAGKCLLLNQPEQIEHLHIQWKHEKGQAFV